MPRLQDDGSGCSCCCWQGGYCYCCGSRLCLPFSVQKPLESSCWKFLKHNHTLTTLFCGNPYDELPHGIRVLLIVFILLLEFLSALASTYGFTGAGREHIEDRLEGRGILIAFITQGVGVAIALKIIERFPCERMLTWAFSPQQQREQGSGWAKWLMFGIFLLAFAAVVAFLVLISLKNAGRNWWLTAAVFGGQTLIGLLLVETLVLLVTYNIKVRAGRNVDEEEEYDEDDEESGGKGTQQNADQRAKQQKDSEDEDDEENGGKGTQQKEEQKEKQRKDSDDDSSH
ncbi:hypothetical protein QOT17_008846 [Balamuthia mandrillaris]